MSNRAEKRHAVDEDIEEYTIVIQPTGQDQVKKDSGIMIGMAPVSPPMTFTGVLDHAFQFQMFGRQKYQLLIVS